MEKFFLRQFFGGKKLNVVHQQKIHRPVLVAECLIGFLPDGGDQFISELFTGGIEYLFSRIVSDKIVSDCLQ